MRKNRFIIKTVLCIAGLVILAWIASTYRNYRLQERKAPYVTKEEVRPVAEAFFSVRGIASENDGIEFLFSEESQDAGQETADNREAEEYVTYGQLLKILEYLPLTDQAVLEEYKNDDWYIGLADWKVIVLQWMELYGDDRIYSADLMLLGTADHITDQDGNGLEENEIYTDLGIYNNQYPYIHNFLFTNVKAICFVDQILMIMEQVESDRRISNLYLADMTEEQIHLFWNGYHFKYPQNVAEWIENVDITNEVSGKIIDIGFKNGKVQILDEKEEYVHGKLLQVTEETIEIEGYGIYPVSEDMTIYRLYSELRSMGMKDLRIGYAFTDFVMENGEIVACLMIKEEDMKNIRVLLKNTDLEGRYHEGFSATCDHSCEVITYQNGVEIARYTADAGEQIIIEPDSMNVGNQRVKLIPAVLSAKIITESIGRSQGIPSYFGTMEITRAEDGLLVINEVLLEDYLCKVVPSEMPSSYPKEALMTQAVCARTYAYGKMLKTGLPALGAHVDDSAGFQVYNNINEQVSTTEAVKATHNMIAVYQGEPIGAYYYSTSCGVGSDTEVWHGSGENPKYLKAREIGRKNSDEIALELTDETAFREWITQSKTSHYEAEEGWYRWTYETKDLDISHMEEVLRKRYENNPKLILTKNKNGEFESKELAHLGKILDIEITKRVAGGCADELVITGTKATVKVLSELNIRNVLADGETKVVRQTGDEVNASSSLPSGFLIIDLHKEDDIVTGYSILGGGFGHGVGMSQNGAKNMAKAGMTCEEILEFFYQGSELKTLQFEE